MPKERRRGDCGGRGSPPAARRRPSRTGRATSAPAMANNFAAQRPATSSLSRRPSPPGADQRRQQRRVHGPLHGGQPRRGVGQQLLGSGQRPSEHVGDGEPPRWPGRGGPASSASTFGPSAGAPWRPRSTSGGARPVGSTATARSRASHGILEVAALAHEHQVAEGHDRRAPTDGEPVDGRDHRDLEGERPLQGARG